MYVSFKQRLLPDLRFSLGMLGEGTAEGKHIQSVIQILWIRISRDFFVSVPISPVIGLRTSCGFVNFPGQPTYHCQINLSKEQFWITFLLSTQVLCDLHCKLDQIKYIKLVVKSFQSRTSNYLVLAFYSSLHISPYSGGVLFKLGSAKHQRLDTLIT